MDVTEQILQQHILYGASENTAPQGLAASKSLNFANGGSIQRAEQERVTVIPFTLNYKGTTGLFGAENYFVKVEADVPLDFVLGDFEEEGWKSVVISITDFDPSTVFDEADIDYALDLSTVNTYEPARMDAAKADTDSFISVDLTNLKTGNIYMDSWLDVRLYTASREEHPYDKMYVRLHDYFYIGFHARNTRRLDYNVKAIIGDELVSASAIEDTRYVARTQF